MHCRKATQLISEAMDRDLSRKERLALWIHLGICSHCRRYRRQLAMIREAIRRFAVGIDEAANGRGTTLPSEARRRIMEALTAGG